jgi:AbrB family looped-hinge helix DNA binding protein
MSKIHTSTVTSKGQIVIPAPLRKKYGLKQGSKVVLTEGADEIHVRPMDIDFFEEFAGILGGEGKALRELAKSRSEERRREKARPR